MKPTISIITICFNNLHDLQATAQTVDEQVLPPHEHIVINGSTQPAIQQWMEGNAQPAYRKAVHQRDEGIADAFNKGIALATGDILLLLNAGDTLGGHDTLHTVAQLFEANPGITWLHGKYWYQRGGVWVVLGKPYQRARLYRGMRSICHQTMYVRREVYARYGPFSKTYSICMDYDYLVRMRDEPFLFTDSILARFAPGGVSMQRSKQILQENYAIYTQYCGFSLRQWLWNIRLYMLISLMNSPVGRALYRLKVRLGLANM